MLCFAIYWPVVVPFRPISYRSTAQFAFHVCAWFIAFCFSHCVLNLGSAKGNTHVDLWSWLCLLSRFHKSFHIHNIIRFMFPIELVNDCWPISLSFWCLNTIFCKWQLRVGLLNCHCDPAMLFTHFQQVSQLSAFSTPSEIWSITFRFGMSGFVQLF